jgi:CRP-like cAMP-binding protein
MDNNQTDRYDQFLSQFPLRYYPAGHILISPNEELTGIYWIESGRVRKYDVTRFHDKVVMNVFSAPILFPLSWVLNHTPNMYYFEALSRVGVRFIPTEEIAAYLKTDPDLVYSLLQQVYLGLENTQRRVVHLTRGSARSRLLFELLIEARRSGEEQSNGSVIITISETDLAERAGLSRETISRELAKVFKISDLCVRQGRSIIIRDLQELEATLQKTT